MGNGYTAHTFGNRCKPCRNGHFMSSLKIKTGLRFLRESCPDRLRIHIRIKLESQRAIVICEDDGSQGAVQAASGKDARFLHQAAGKIQTPFTVMIPRNEQDLDPSFLHLGQEFIKEFHRFDRRHTTVINIAGNHHGLCPFFLNERHKLVFDEIRLLFCQMHPMEIAAEMPVCRMNKTHDSFLSGYPSHHGIPICQFQAQSRAPARTCAKLPYRHPRAQAQERHGLSFQ